MLLLTLMYDRDCPNPLHDRDGQWTFHCFDQRRVDSISPEEFALKFANDEDSERELQRKFDVGLAFWCDYYEHGEGQWTVSGTGQQCPWDSTAQAGIIVWENPEEAMGAKFYQDRQRDAAACLAEYSDWCNGHCYGFEINRSLGGKIEIIDNTFGFIGHDYMVKELKGILDKYPNEEVYVTGEAKEALDIGEIESENFYYYY